MAASDIRLNGSAVDKTVLLTGPTGGLGREAALAVARRGSRLVLVGRPSKAFSATVADAMNAGAGLVDAIEVDFADLASISTGARQVRELLAASDTPLDALVGNAGLQMSNRVQATVDGLETTFAVNVVANHLFISSLVDVLAPEAHVVVVGSGTHYGEAPATLLVAAPRWDDPARLARPGGPEEAGPRDGQRAYSTSKLAVNYLVHEFQRRAVNAVRYNVYDPGLMPGTGLARDMPAWKRWVWNNVMPRFVFLPGMATPAESGELLARFALGLDHHDLRGGYVELAKVTEPSKESNDPARESSLWNACETLTAQFSGNSATT